MKTLRCRALVKSFNGVRALSDVSLEFPTGITAVIGPNGAGKTTLLNILTGFSQPDSGNCYWGEQVICGLRPHNIVGLGIARTFQELRLISQMSVLEHLLAAFPNQRGERLLDALMRIRVAEAEKQNRAHAATILSMFGLANKSAEMAGEISYGEQKLLSLACCFATGAQILLLDEPVAGVHPDMALRILGHLQELRQAGRTVVFIEHDLTAVRKVADFVVLLDQGKALAQGPPRQVFERPEMLEAYFE